jgi:DNA-directed RNA polymerase subunit RPC12/RpoP
MAEMFTGGTNRTRCQGCGSKVSRRFCRVFGDNQDFVYGCPRCTSMRDLAQGGAAVE